MTTSNARPIPVRRIIGFHLLGLYLLLFILDRCTRSDFDSWLLAIPFFCGVALLIPDLIRVRPLHRLLGWICIVILAPLIAFLCLYYLIDPLTAVVAIFPLLLGLFLLFPKQKWLLIITWVLFAAVYWLSSTYFYSGLLTVWLGFPSHGAIVSLALNIALIFPIIMSVLAYREWKKNQEE